MATVLNLITEALVTVKALAVGETPGADMTTDALAKFNDVLEALSIQNLAVFASTATTFPLVQGQAVYTIGPTGGVVAARPPYLATGYITMQGADFNVDLTRTDEEYAGLAVKNTPGVPEWGFYEPTYPNGTLTLWPVPYTASTMTILVNRAFTSATSLADVFAMPPGYRRMVKLMLACELAVDYPGMSQGEIGQLRSDAQAALALVKRNNRKPALLRSEVSQLDCSGGFNGGNWRSGA